MKCLVAFLLIFFSLNSFCQKFEGYYHTPGLSLGFFKTKIALFKDSTFIYEFSGDLQYERREGKFTFQDNLIKFKLEPKFDTIVMYWKDYNFDSNVDTTNLGKAEPIIYDVNENITKNYLLRGNKLIPLSDDLKTKYRKGKLVKIHKDKWKNLSGAGIFRAQ